MPHILSIDDVVEWLRRKKIRFVNARRIARAFKISSRSAGHLLRKLKELGYITIHKKRKGRFIVYKVDDSLLNKVANNRMRK